MAWTWSGVTDTKLSGLLDKPMRSLANFLSTAERTFPSLAVVRTTDATVTTIHSEKIPVDQTLGVVGYVVARRTGGSSGTANDGAMYRVEFAGKNTSGTAALVGGAGVVTTLAEDQSGWTVTLSASAASVLVRVTGASNNNITWTWSAKSLAVKE